LGVFVALGLLAVALSVAIAFWVLPAFQIPVPQLGVARLVLVLAGITVAVSLVSGVFGGTLVGLQRFDLSNAIEIASGLLRAGAVVVALSSGGGLIALSLIHLGFGILNGLAYAGLSLKLYPELRIRASACGVAHLRLIFSFSAYAFLLHMATFLIFYTDSLVISAFLPVGMVTYFAIAGNLANYTRAMISGISTTMTPLASSLQAAGRDEELERVLLRGTRFATLLVLPVGFTFLLRGDSFVGLWMGSQYAGPSGQVLRILTLALIFSAGNQVAASTMLGISRHRTLVPLALAEAASNLVISIALVRRTGIIGVAWGTTLPSLAVNLLFWPWYVRRTLKIPVPRYVAGTWVRPAMAMFAFVGGTYAVERYWPASNLSEFFLQVAATMPLALAGAWAAALNPEDRAQIHAKLAEPVLRILRGV
jgi:O-antigen/teichoic acid export membrane protein